ncbi:hypothetical protein GCM10022419_135760 [Nonomuraea rosea]|uniref:Uncharacterized protein n=1 Tax=Nonomuraea rosea TaxID=638574 RepID=A0ABP7A8Y3_9ACTN
MHDLVEVDESEAAVAPHDDVVPVQVAVDGLGSQMPLLGGVRQGDAIAPPVAGDVPGGRRLLAAGDGAALERQKPIGEGAPAVAGQFLVQVGDVPPETVRGAAAGWSLADPSGPGAAAVLHAGNRERFRPLHAFDGVDETADA